MSKSKTRKARPLQAEPAHPSQHPREGSKQALLIQLLSRPKGASLDDLVGATGWLPHTTRAALTGLRRRGFAIEREATDDGRSRYRVAAAETDKPARKTRTGQRRGSARAEAPASR